MGSVGGSNEKDSSEEFDISLYGEGVMEFFSYRNDRASRIVSTFVIGDADDDDESERQHDGTPALVRGRSFGPVAPRAAVFDRILCSLDLRPAIVRLG